MSKFYALKGKDVFDISKVTVVGSPTITSDGVLTNVNPSNYLKSTFTLDKLDGKSWSFICKTYWNGRGNGTYDTIQIGDTHSYFRITSTQELVFNAYLDTDNSQVYGAKFAPTIFDVSGWYWLKMSFDYATGTYRGYAGKNKNDMTQLLEIVKGEGEQLRRLDSSHFLLFKTNGTTFPYKLNLLSFEFYVDNQLIYTPTKPTYLLERRKGGYDPSKFTVVGTPNITEYGVASGFTTANYIKTSGFNIGQLKGKSWEIKCKWYFDVNTTDTYSINDILNLSETYHPNGYMGASTNNKRLRIMITTGVTGASQLFYQESTMITESGWVEQKLTFDVNTGTYTFYNLKPNSTTWESREWVATTENKELLVINERPSDCFQIGRGKDAIIGYTPVILPSISITVDNKEVFTGAKEQFYMLRR